LEKATPVPLRTLGLDERWLQDRISSDPTILGLGDNLEIAGREHHQPIGGRIDFLMRDAQEQIYYEVEVMLGSLDESHIIRTIEYWDIERQRRPQWDHRAVIVAEQITTRFFNVLRLLNRAVPLIAIKLSAFPMNGRVVLHPVTVLDVIEETTDDAVDPVERVDRAYWEREWSSLVKVLDKVVALLKQANIDPRLTYNRGHIALGTSGRNFCWFYLRIKLAGNSHIEFRLTPETRDAVIGMLQESGVGASPVRTDLVGFNITAEGLEKHVDVIKGALEKAEELSR
jgi:hypothetical protein